MLKKILLWLLIPAVALAGSGFVWVQSRHEGYPEAPASKQTPIAGSALSASLQTTLTQRLEQYREQHNVPSISAAIGVNGRLAYAQAVGFANLKQQTPATTRSLYRIGSVSKSITAVALGDLMESGQIDLDAPFGGYVADFPAKRWSFTARQLASHTAGVRHYRDGFIASLRENYQSTHYETVADSLDLIADDPLLFEPGTQFRYSSYGYNMLSAAMAAAAGRPFAELLQSRVFNPAGMTTAHVEDAPDPHPDSVSFYLQAGEDSYLSPYTDNSYKVAGGGLMSTPSELVAFGIALMNGKLVSEETRAVLFDPRPLADGTVTNYALGFRINQRQLAGRDLKEISHGGSSIGGLTALAIYPEPGVVIAVTINISSIDSSAHPRIITDEFAELVVQSLLP